MLYAPIDTSTVRGFFSRRDDAVWVEGYVEQYTGLRDCPSGRDLRRPVGRVLEYPETEGELFGEPGTLSYDKTLAQVVNLSQIVELIRRQECGQEGELLIDGFKNLFPVQGLDGGLYIVRGDWSADYPRRWFLDCYPYNPLAVWHEGNKVFMNP